MTSQPRPSKNWTGTPGLKKNSNLTWSANFIMSFLSRGRKKTSQLTTLSSLCVNSPIRRVGDTFPSYVGTFSFNLCWVWQNIPPKRLDGWNVFLVEFVIEFHLNGWFDRSAASGWLLDVWCDCGVYVPIYMYIHIYRERERSHMYIYRSQCI